jgi:hypothetical protein
VGPHRRPNPASLRKQREIEELNERGRQRIGALNDDAFFAAGLALYAGEGAKTDGAVKFTNSDPQMVEFFCAWFRRYFVIDEARLRVGVYLHLGLDIDRTQRYWSDLTGIPLTQFIAPYRAEPDPSIRRNKHEHGCATVSYSCSHTHREIMGLTRALLSSTAYSGVAQ